MAGREPTRQEDEQVLDWLALRSEGKNAGEIAKAHGVTASRVRTVTNRVRADDYALEKSVGAYW